MKLESSGKRTHSQLVTSLLALSHLPTVSSTSNTIPVKLAETMRFMSLEILDRALTVNRPPALPPPRDNMGSPFSSGQHHEAPGEYPLMASWTSIRPVKATPTLASAGPCEPEPQFHELLRVSFLVWSMNGLVGRRVVKGGVPDFTH